MVFGIVVYRNGKLWWTSAEPSTQIYLHHRGLVGTVTAPHQHNSVTHPVGADVTQYNDTRRSGGAGLADGVLVSVCSACSACVADRT